MVKKILISGCLIGLKCNYKGEASSGNQERLFSIIKKYEENGYEFIPACPEQLGGMPTPRIPSELISTASEILCGKGKVISKNGDDVTGCFVKGAKEALFLAKRYNVVGCVLKSRSPSCGNSKIYDGTFSGALISGRGVTSQLLVDSGLIVLNELEFVKDENCTLCPSL